MEPETHRIIVPRSARFLTLGETGDALEDVWLLCHGYGQLAAEFLGFAHALASDRSLLVAPEALSRFYHEDHKKVGACWMTREDRLTEMEDYVRYLDRVHDEVFEIVPRSAVKLRLFGYSQGVATASRWAVRGSGKVDELVVWGSPLPPELDDEPSSALLREMKVTLVAGRRDPFFTEKEWSSERERLGRLRVDFDEMRFDGGHRLDDDTLRALAKRP
jgi:predicted esterase